MAKVALTALLVAGLLYLAAAALLFGFQRRLIYPAPTRVFTLADRSSGFRDVRVRTEDGLTLRALYRPATGGRPVLVFFHGNGDGLGGAIVATRAFADSGYGLMLPEYRGYGGNPGAPSEAGLYRDGEAALRWLAGEGVPVGGVVLVGNSLGSGVATELAARHRVRALALISGFTSLADVAAAKMRAFPVRPLLRDRYDNAAKLPRVAAPVLVLHGTADTLIPPAHGVALARAATRGRLELVPEVGHELAYLPDAQKTALRWLRSLETQD